MKKHFYLDEIKGKENYTITNYEWRDEKKYFKFLKKIYQFGSYDGMELYLKEVFDKWQKDPFNSPFYMKHSIIRQNTLIELNYHITVRFIVYDEEKKIIPIFYF